MKYLNKISLFLAAALLPILWSCSSDVIDPQIQGLEIQNFDAVQVTNSQPFVVVPIEVNATSLGRVDVTITPEGGTEAVASNSITSMTGDGLTRVSLQIPFPTPDVAPSGVYTVTTTVVGKDDKTSSTSYTINLVNNQQVPICTFEDEDLPAGTNTWIYVSTPAPVPSGDNVYVTGSFEGWSGGGNPAYAMTRVSDQCFKIAVQLSTDDEFKITRGDWGREMRDESGSGTNAGNISYEGASPMRYTVYNWADLPTINYDLPEVLPNEAIKSGMLTAVFQLAGSIDKTATYHVVPEGASDLSQAVLAYPVEGTNKVAAAVARTEGVNYVLIEGDDLNKVGKTPNTPLGAFGPGDNLKVTWDGQTNPALSGEITYFEQETLAGDIYIMGGGTPSGWTNTPPESQKFTETSPGVYEVTVDLTTDIFSIVTVYGNWNPRFGKDSGDFNSGNLGYGNDVNFDAPPAAGTYKVVVDLNTATYTVTLL